MEPYRELRRDLTQGFSRAILRGSGKSPPLLWGACFGAGELGEIRETRLSARFCPLGSRAPGKTFLGRNLLHLATERSSGLRIADAKGPCGPASSLRAEPRRAGGSAGFLLPLFLREDPALEGLDRLEPGRLPGLPDFTSSATSPTSARATVNREDIFRFIINEDQHQQCLQK